METNISKFLDSSSIKKSRSRLSSVLIYLIIVMIQSRNPSVLYLMNTKKTYSAKERNYIINLIIDILNNESLRSMFDDQQLLQLIDSNDVGVNLMRISLPISSLKGLPKSCYSKLVQQEHDFIVSSKLNEFVHSFSQNLAYCLENEIDLPDQLRRIPVSADDGFSSNLVIQKMLHSMDITKPENESNKSSFADIVIERALESKSVEDAYELASMVFMLEPEELIQVICSLVSKFNYIYIFVMMNFSVREFKNSVFPKSLLLVKKNDY